jgi:membrane protein DedA with SNARE-associated domain
LALLEGELPEGLTDANTWLTAAMSHQGHLAAFPLLYLEESGFPLPAPGDLIIVYLGSHLPHTLPAWLGAWVGLVSVVLLGSTNLYLVARLLGRRVAESRAARWIHLTPERLAKAESWFARWGILAIIFGRHIPGLRVPITVAAGILRVPYLSFAASVAVSTAVWAGFWLIVGITVGGRIVSYLSIHRGIWWLLAAMLVVGVIAYAVHGRIRT